MPQLLRDPPFVEPPGLLLAEMTDCRVRRFRRSDMPAVERALCDPAVWRSYTPEDASPVLTPDCIENYLRWLHQPGFFSFAACTPDTDEVLGCIHADCGQGAMSGSAELSGWMARSHWRSSIARRVNEAFVDWLFTQRGVLRVYSHCYHPNRAAIGSLRAAGFTLEARLRNAGVKDGFLMDRLVFARLNPAAEGMPRAPDRENSWLQQPQVSRQQAQRIDLPPQRAHPCSLNAATARPHAPIGR
jgi:[ribosomal protein S5]-alanine N-acetyltransferase